MQKLLSLLICTVCLSLCLFSCGGGSSGSDSAADEKVSFREITVNNKWAVRVFNDFPSALSVKAKTDNSITFSLNQPLEGMIQVVFDGRNYAKGSDYTCSYKLKGPSSGEMTVCWWVDEQNQSNEITSYNTVLSNRSLSMSCTSSGWGVVLFFPTAVGEYTISDIAISNN